MEKFDEKIFTIIRDNMIDEIERGIINYTDEFISDLGFDSIKFMGLFYALEEELNIEIINGNKNYLFFSIETVQDLIDTMKTFIFEKELHIPLHRESNSA